jgi:hypothetical protein
MNENGLVFDRVEDCEGELPGEKPMIPFVGLAMDACVIL